MIRKSGSTVFAKYGIQAALLCGLLLFVPAVSWSQASSATLHGIVTDPTGAVIPGAAVRLTDQNTGATMAQTSGESGDFAFTFVPVGVYTIRIEVAGFKTHTTTGINLTTRQQVRR